MLDFLRKNMKKPFETKRAARVPDISKAEGTLRKTRQDRKVSLPTMDKDAVAKLLNTSPEALSAFEDAYEKIALNKVSDNFFQINSRQASAQKRREAPIGEAAIETVSALQRRIVDELLAQTPVYVFDGNLGKTEHPMALPAGTAMVSKEEVNKLPEPLRPQLTGELMSIDIPGTSDILLYYYDQFQKAQNDEARASAYHHFRQGLDILDLDALTYRIIGTNRNSMGHWLPQLVEVCRDQKFFHIPATVIARVPLTLLQLTRREYGGLTPTTLGIVDQWAYKALRLREDKEYFIKTGTYSSKFDFRNAYVHGRKEVRELGEYLLYIHYQALQMASPLCEPCIYGASTTNEWVVREFIQDKENNPLIYKGLPLHTEYRVFVDCDTGEVIGVSPYWEPETMKRRLGHGPDADSIHQLHDYAVYKAHEDTLMRRYHENKDAVVAHIREILPALALKGQWSIDVMQNGDDFWLIDMALAENSAFYDCVPTALRRPSKENWLPELPETDEETNS